MKIITTTTINTNNDTNNGLNNGINSNTCAQQPTTAVNCNRCSCPQLHTPEARAKSVATRRANLALAKLERLGRQALETRISGGRPKLKAGMLIRLRTAINVNGLPVDSLCVMSENEALAMRKSRSNNYGTYVCGIVNLNEVYNNILYICSRRVISEHLNKRSSDAFTAQIIWRAPKVKRVTMAEIERVFGRPV